MAARELERQVPVVGDGGWAGIISFPAMATAVQEGYATASTDTGHKGGNALFAIGHPEKLVDFAYRAVHETTVQTKALITKFYDRAPRLSYWNGCSTGGRQGLMEAQKYPGRLRRDHRRRAGELPDAPARVGPERRRCRR